MKKAIEKNAKEDETLSFTLEKLDNDRQLALCQVWGKKEAFIRGTAKKIIGRGLGGKYLLMILEWWMNTFQRALQVEKCVRLQGKQRIIKQK